MRAPNILRRSGGVGTKLKDEKKAVRFLITALLVACGLCVCFLLYNWFDRVMNGYVLDWLEQTFIQYDYQYVADGQTGYLQRIVRWGRVKEFVYELLIAAVVLWILSARVISLLYASYRERRLFRELGQNIGDYMRHDREISEVFPPRQAEVSVQLSEIKANIQRHEQLLKEETGRKNDLITYLAHDLKTPLTSVIGYLSLMEEAPDMPPEQKAKYVHVALDKALRLEKLINEFFEITRYNLQQIVLEKETVDLAFMLMQMTDEFYPILSAHGNTVRLKLPEEDASLRVYADADMLARVFNNILKNAVAYSYSDTEICVKAERVENRVCISFSNRGKTIPRQRLNSIFEKFFRLDDARATNTGGAGLGLAIAKEIVVLHGGSITAESEDEVTVFTVEIPAQE